MDLLKLERMVAIYEAGSFRKAAKDLGMSQPALTWSVRQLEETFNARLFERGPRGIRPTDLCERLVRRARLIFREQERMLGDVGDTCRNQTINLGVHSIFVTSEFARAIATFSQTWPTATLRVRDGFSSDLIERLGRGELDFACCALPDDLEEGGAFVAEPLALLNYSVVARADHPVFDDLARGQPIGSYPWVEFDVAIVGCFPGGRDIEAVMDKVGRAGGQRSVRTASMPLIRKLVLDGNFIGLIADQSIADDLADGRLKRLPGTQIVASSFGFLGLKDDFETQAVADLKDILRTAAFRPLQGTQAPA